MNRIDLARHLGVTAAAAVSLVVGAPATAHAFATSSASVSVEGRVLTVLGTDANDAVGLVFAPDGSTATVNLGDGPQTFDRRTFDTVVVRLGAGDDQLRTTTGGGAVPDAPLVVDGGEDDDAILGGSGNDVLVGGNGDDTVLGGGGADVIFGGNGRDRVDGGVGVDTEHLGSGSDTAVWLPGEGNDVVDGGAGKDTLVFDGSDGAEQISVSRNGDGAVLLRNLGSIRMDLASVEATDVAAFGGADVVTVNDLAGSGTDEVHVDLRGQNGNADGALDHVVVNGTEHDDRFAVDAEDGSVSVHGLPTLTTVTGDESTDVLQLNGLGGTDRAVVDNAVRFLIDVVVDLGADQ